MVLLLQSDGDLPKLRVTGLDPEQDPYIGFADAELAAQFCEGWKITEPRRTFLTLKPGTLPDRRDIALFESMAELERYLSAPQAFPCQKLMVRSLGGWITFLPCVIRRKLRRF